MDQNRIAPDTVHNAPSTTVHPQFPSLQSTEGTFSYTLQIGKESRPYIIALFIIAILVLLFLGALIPLTYISQRESRLAQQALDEKRLENRAAWKELGIDGNALEDHDISDLMRKLRDKYPPEKHQ